MHNQIKRNDDRALSGYKGVNRSKQRLVIDKNGKIYYTNDYYKTFVKVPRKKRMIR
ncbi:MULTISPECIES: ribonuclease domain-containing protein [unclassified Bacillus (in: firmicutes)]|uniref:ribonuclease domain-containing protein n=1 Tax=unclassified Bacillus (in: firmicutes) TaxID=185979 RepID=UPI0020C86144|nr:MULTISPECIES: ribonuclease domain-containing protein [unclassified Bacillus (in: firmicutes)]